MNENENITFYLGDAAKTVPMGEYIAMKVYNREHLKWTTKFTI